MWLDDTDAPTTSRDSLVAYRDIWDSEQIKRIFALIQNRRIFSKTGFFFVP